MLNWLLLALLGAGLLGSVVWRFASDQKPGREAMLYRNTGTWDSPTWSEITCVKDVSLDAPDGEIAAPSRASVFNLTLAGLTDATINLEVIHSPSDANFVALRDAKTNRTAIEIAIMDGDITTVGSHGLRANFRVLNFTRNEPLEDELTYTVTLKPTPSSNNPTWYSITS